MSVTQASLLGDTFGSKASGTIPVGGIIMWSGSATPYNATTNPTGIPAGWALCNGSNGTPDLRDRFIVGAGSGYNPGNTGGANSVALDLTQIPSHDHNFNDPGHTHEPTNGSTVRNDGGTQIRVTSSEKSELPVSNALPTRTTGITFNAQGGGQAHENRPPYFALAFIMRLS